MRPRYHRHLVAKFLNQLSPSFPETETHLSLPVSLFLLCLLDIKLPASSCTFYCCQCLCYLWPSSPCSLPLPFPTPKNSLRGVLSYHWQEWWRDGIDSVPRQSLQDTQQKSQEGEHLPNSPNNSTPLNQVISLKVCPCVAIPHLWVVWEASKAFVDKALSSPETTGVPPCCLELGPAGKGVCLSGGWYSQISRKDQFRVYSSCLLLF